MLISILLLPLIAASSPEYLLNSTISSLTDIVHFAMMTEARDLSEQNHKEIIKQIPGIEESFSNQTNIILNYRSKQYVETLNGTLDQSDIIVTITLEDIANRFLQIIASSDNIPDSPLMSSGFMTQLEMSGFGSSKIEEQPDLRVKVGLPAYDALKESGTAPLKWYFTKISRFNSSIAPVFESMKMMLA